MNSANTRSSWAVLVFTEPWHDTFRNLMLLVAGALFAAVFGAVGRGAEKLRLFARRRLGRATR